MYTLYYAYPIVVMCDRCEEVCEVSPLIALYTPDIFYSSICMMILWNFEVRQGQAVTKRKGPTSRLSSTLSRLLHRTTVLQYYLQFNLNSFQSVRRNLDKVEKGGDANLTYSDLCFDPL